MKKLLLLLAIAFLAQTVFAAQSMLELSKLPDGRYFVSNLYDDDGSIELLEVYSLTISETRVSTRFVFENVIQGQVLEKNFFELPRIEDNPRLSGQVSGYPSGIVASLVEETPLTRTGRRGEDAIDEAVPVVDPVVYYNFLDTDGQVTNAKFFIYLTAPYNFPAVIDNTIFEPGPVRSKSLKQRIDSSGNYFVDVQVFAPEAESVEFFYSFGPESGQENCGDLSNPQVNCGDLTNSGGGLFTGSIGPFSEKVVLNAKITATLASKSYDYLFEQKAFGVVKKNIDGTCSAGQSTFLQKNDFSAQKSVFLAGPASPPSPPPVDPLLKLPFIRIEEDSSAPAGGKNLKAVFLSETSAISAVEVLIEIPQDGQEPEIQRRLFNQVSDEQVLGLGPVPENAKIYYNYQNYETTQNLRTMNFFLPVKKEDSLDMPVFTHEQEADILDAVAFEVQPSPDCRSYTIRATATLLDASAKAFLRYGFSRNNMPFFLEMPQAQAQAGLSEGTGKKVLLQSGSGYEYELGPFSSGTEIYANFYAENSSGQTDKITGTGTEIGLQGAAVAQQEQCGNYVDDDSDGAVDEGCVLLSDLFFLSENLSEFYPAGSPANISAEVKNAGVISAQAFEVSLYVDNVLLDTKNISGLAAGESQTAGFSAVLEESLSGRKTIKLVIDPSNTVLELNEYNNEAEKDAFIGNNSFDIALNFNNAEIIGDTRIIRAFDRLGNTVHGALIELSLPSGGTLQLETDNGGFVEFVIEETGSFLLTASKNGFEDFQGAFRVPKILVPVKETYSLGEEFSVSVQTEDGNPVSGIEVIVTTPLNETKTFFAGEKFQLSTPGTHRIEIFRNSVKIFGGTFLVTGLLESIFVASSPQELLFGSIINDTPLFLFLLFLCGIAAWFFYQNEKTIIPLKPATSSQKLAETFLKIIVTVVFFLLPFQAARFYGFNAGLLVAVLEILLVLALTFRAKKKKEKRPIGF